MIDFGFCKEDIIGPSEAKATLVVRAEAYWQGLRAHQARVPTLAECDPARLDGDGRLIGVVKMLPGGDVGYETVGRTLRRMDGDYTGRRLSEMTQWSVVQDLARGHWAQVCSTAKPLIGEDWFDPSSAFQWTLLPFSSDAKTVDGALMLHDYDHLIDRHPQEEHLLESLVNAFDHIAVAIIILTPDLRVTFLNNRATELARTGDLVAVDSNGRLTIRSKSVSRALRKARASAASYRIVEGRYSISVTAISGCFLLALRSLDVELDFRSIAEALQLSPAEARIVVALARGSSLGDIACDFAISKHTVRTQVRSAMNKMGVSRQQEIVRLMCIAAGV